MSPAMRRVLVLMCACLTSVLGGCGVDERLEPLGASGGSGGGGGSGGSDAGGNASFHVTGSVEQIFVTHAKPGTELSVVSSTGLVTETGKADELGSYVFRKLPP